MNHNLINAYYLRLSLEDGDVADGTSKESCSIMSQRLCIKQFLSQHPELGTDYEEFSDDGYSGTNLERPGISKLLQMVEAGLVKTIIVRDLSRFARNYLEAGHYLEFIFPAYGVRFISINDHYDSRDFGENPAGLDLAIRNLINEMYSKDISKKIKTAVDLKKRRGEFVYGTAPFGYKKGESKNTIIPDDEAALIVKRIFNMAISGLTITEIARALNRDHIPTPSQHLAAYRSEKYRVYTEWTWNSVKNILENRIYTGDTEPFKSHVVKIGSNRTKKIPNALREVIPDTHDAIITRDQYYMALKTIKSTQKKPGNSQNNPLTSKLFCGCCGNRLTKGKVQNKVWLCPNARYTVDLDCKEIRPSEDKLKSIILRAIQNQCTLVEVSLQEALQYKKANQSEKDIVATEIKSLQRRHEAIQVRKQSLLEAVMDDQLSRDDYKSKKGLLIQEDNTISGKITLLQEKLSQLEIASTESDSMAKLSSELSKFSGITELTPDVMTALVNKVIIYPDNQIRIEWRFLDTVLSFSK